MTREEKRSIVEALIAGSPEPIPSGRIAEVIPYLKPGKVGELVEELNAEYAEQQRAFEIWEVAGGYQMRTRAEFSAFLQQVQRTRPLRLSPAALETLAIIAYRQPVTRAEIEHVRGVDAGAVVRSLLERKLVRIAGHREVPGRPMLYATTRRFLEVFGLTRLEDLPTLRDLEELQPSSAVAGAPEQVTPGPEAGEPPLDALDTVDASEAEVESSGEPEDPALVAFEEAEPSGKPH